MAADTNVGTATIGLDIEATGDLKAQIQGIASGISDQIKEQMQNIGNLDFSSIADTISDSIKNSIESSMATLRETIQTTLNSALAGVNVNVPVNYAPSENEQEPSSNTTSTRAPRAPPSRSNGNREAISSQIENLTGRLDIVNAQIDRQREKLAALREQYNNTFNEARRNALEEQILRTEAAINRLTATSDRTGFRLADLDAQLVALNSAAQTAESGINEETEALVRNTTETNRVSEATNRAGNSLRQTNDRMRETTNRSNEMSYGIAAIANQFFTWMLVLPAVMSGLSALGSGLLADLKTNDQFNNSLAQIKTNLMVSFTPIFYAILPAINALMSALATATTYIASFISSIFGKTYQQSYQATQGLIDAKNAMGAYGDSTKKAAKDTQSALAGFDEINKLTKPTTADTTNDKVPVLVQPNVDTSAIDNAVSPIATKVKDILSKVFEPFKDAWANEGQSTIGSVEYALGGIWSLISSIGKSFLEVWTNGTGTAILTNLLKIFQDILSVVGDIGFTFANAWNSGNIGTQIVQALANAFNNVLGLIDKMLQSVRKVWAEEGPTFANLFMQALNFTAQAIENVTQKLGWIWDHGGQHAFEGLVKLGLKVGELALFIYNQFVVPFVNWFVNTITPALAPVLDAVGSLFDKLSNMIDWLMGSGKPVLDVIITLLGSIATAIGIVKIALLAYEVVTWLCTYGTTALGIALLSINWPLVLITAGIAAVIAIGVLLYQHWDTVKAVAANVWEGIKNIFMGAVDFLKNNWQGILLFLVNPFAGGFKLLYDNCEGFRNFINGLVNSIKDFFVWLGDSIKNIFSGIGAWFGNKFTEAADAIKNVFGNIGSFFGNIWNVIKQQFTNIGSTIGNAIGGAFKAVVNSIISFAQNAINGFIGAINGAIGLINKIPGVNIKTISQLNIPKLAQGGVISQPTLAMVGEAGDEAVVPLKNNTQGLDMVAEKILERIGNTGATKSTTSNADRPIQLIIQVGNTTLGQAAIKSINEIARANGTSGILI